MIRTSLLNLVLRGLTLISKFILLLFIAKFLTPEELGIWGLMNTTIGMSLLVLGLDFYVFNTREILSRGEADRVPMIRDQLVFHGLVYLIILPLLLAVFAGGIIAWRYVGWFYGLLILEHLSQEATRLLIILSRPTRANLVLFLRSGSWVYAALVAAFYLEDWRGLPLIWAGWVLGVIVSIGVAFITLRQMPWDRLKGRSVNWRWIIKGVKISLPFFMATLSFSGIQFIDRYFLQHFMGEAAVGVYTFYANIANVIHVFVFTGVVMILYPRLIESFQKGRFDEYRALVRRMSMGIVGGLILLPAIALVLIGPVLQLVGKEIYAEQIGIFTIMLGTVSLLTLSYIPHYALFVRRHDRAIVYSTLVAFGVTVVGNFYLVPRFGLAGAAWAAFAAMATMIVTKSIVIIVIKRRDDSGVGD